MTIFRDFDMVLGYVRANGRFIGEKAINDDKSAHAVVLAYADWHRNDGVVEAAVLWERLEDHVSKWTRTQICRICCEPMDATWQPSANRGFFHLTCTNAICPMHGHTLSSDDYSTLPLNPYLKDKVAWKWDYDEVIERTRHYYDNWQHQARSIHKLTQRRHAGIAIYDHDTTDHAIAAVTIHKTPEGEVPF